MFRMTVLGPASGSPLPFHSSARILASVASYLYPLALEYHLLSGRLVSAHIPFSLRIYSFSFLEIYFFNFFFQFTHRYLQMVETLGSELSRHFPCPQPSSGDLNFSQALGPQQRCPARRCLLLQTRPHSSCLRTVRPA